VRSATVDDTGEALLLFRVLGEGAMAGQTGNKKGCCNETHADWL
jgi:hypothetical protein